MLFNTHYQILLLAIKSIKFFNLKEDNIIFNSNFNISNNDINNLIKGLFYPDLPCSYFYIKENRIKMEIKLCSILKLGTLGKNLETSIKSQIEESHNGRYSINHSMAYDPKLTNRQVRDAIIARCIVMLFSFFETKDFAFLGYIIHIIQDSYSPVHSYREELTTEEVTYKQDIVNTINDISTNINNLKFISPEITCDNINYTTISDLTYKLIDNNKSELLLSIRTINNNNDPTKLNISNFINKIIELFLSYCSNNSNSQLKILYILLGYNKNNISNSLLNVFSDEKVSFNKINPKIFIKNKKIIDKTQIENNKTNILKDNIIYDNLSHTLRRIYKLITNSLYNDDIINIIFKNQIGGQEYIKKKYIKSFLYYPHQDQKKHAIKDCGYIQIEEYPQILLEVINDTKIILELCLTKFYNINNNESIINAIIDIYNILINDIFYMSDINLDTQVSIKNNDKKDFSILDSRYLNCMKENITITNQKNDLSQIFTDSNSKIIINLSKKIQNYININKYKYKYKIYKTKYILSQANKLN